MAKQIEGVYENVLRCARQEFLEKGFALASLRDIAKAAGSCGTMTALRRVRACGFEEGDARSLEELRALAEEGRLEEALRPVESLFAAYPAVWVSPAQATRFQNGGGLDLARLRKRPPEGLCRVRSPQGTFLGLGRADWETGELRFVKAFWEGENTP